MKETFDFFRSVLGTDAGAFGFVFGLLVLGFYATRKTERILADHDTLAKTAEKIERSLDALKQDVLVIKADLEARRGRSDKRFLQAHSPVSLTSEGRDAAKALGADAMLEAAWNRIEPAIRAAVPSGSAYDVQQFCLERIPTEPGKFFDAAAVDAMKRYAFENGVTLYQVASVLGVMARDKFLPAAGHGPEQA